MSIQQISGWAALAVFAFLVADMLGWMPIKFAGGKTVPTPQPQPPLVPDGDPLASLDKLRAAYVAADEAATAAVAVRDETKAAYQAALEQADLLIDKAKEELVAKPEVPNDAPA